jgi:hypothetical protein
MFREELRISGLEDNFANVLRNGNFIRVSLSRVKEQKIEHFVEMQKKVWNLGLQKAEGMLGGTFSFSQKKVTTFLYYRFGRVKIYIKNIWNKISRN